MVSHLPAIAFAFCSIGDVDEFEEAVLVVVETELLTALLLLVELAFAVVLTFTEVSVREHPNAKIVTKAAIAKPKNRREKFLFIICFLLFQNADAVVSKKSFRIRSVVV